MVMQALWLVSSRRRSLIPCISFLHSITFPAHATVAGTKFGETALTAAVARGRFPVVRYLCTHTNADVNFVDARGVPPLIIALRNGDVQDACEQTQCCAGGSSSRVACYDSLRVRVRLR
jgi:hypothetical protein